MKMKTISAWGALLALLVPGGELFAALNVWVTAPPQKFFVERVGGDAVKVRALVRPGESPATYSPSASRMRALAKADLYFAIGLPVEKAFFRTDGRNMPGLRIVRFGQTTHESAEVDHVPEAGEEDGGEEEDQGHDHAHGHGETDPHLWMDPVKMIAYTEVIAEALSEAQPEKAAMFRRNASDLTADLEVLHAELQEQLSPFSGRAFYINHPALGHFAERYGLKQFTIEHSGTKPSGRRIAEMIKEAREAGVGLVFTQPEFGRGSANILARALDVQVVEIDPLAEDYMNNMRRLAELCARSFAR